MTMTYKSGFAEQQVLGYIETTITTDGDNDSEFNSTTVQHSLEVTPFVIAQFSNDGVVWTDAGVSDASFGFDGSIDTKCTVLADSDSVYFSAQDVSSTPITINARAWLVVTEVQGQ